MGNSNESSSFFQKIKDHSEWMIVITLLTFVISCIYTFFIATPLYEASSELLISPVTNEATEESLESPSTSMGTYAYILTSDPVLEPVIEELALETTAAELRDRVTAEQVDEAEIIILQVQAENPYQASEVANAIMETFEMQVEELSESDTVQVLKAATPSTDLAQPNHLKNIGIGTLIGFIVSLLFVALKGNKDQPQALTPEMVEQVTGLKNLGHVSTFNDDDYLILEIRPKKKVAKVEDEKSTEENLSRMNRNRM